MLILNLGCGASRPKEKEWINVDDLYELFPNPDCPERKQMDSEPNYKNFDIRQKLWLDDNSVDGILAASVVEHFDIQESVKLFRDWYRVLKPGGVLRVIVPDPCKFWEITMAGTEDWGEPNYSRNSNHPMSFTEYALFFTAHKQCVSKETAFCLLYVAGFSKFLQMEFGKSNLHGLAKIDNRQKFSLFIEGIK